MLEDERFIPDANSPVGYKLKSENNGISKDNESRTLKGGGLIIDIDVTRKGYSILTSSHLVSPPDTINFYYTDDTGKTTDILFARHILRKVIVAVRGTTNWLARGEVIADDPANDIAVIFVKTDNRLGTSFGNPIGYDINLDWGDWIFLFGTPMGLNKCQVAGSASLRIPAHLQLTLQFVLDFPVARYSHSPVNRNWLMSV